MKTALTHRFGIEHPIMSAGMAASPKHHSSSLSARPAAWAASGVPATSPTHSETRSEPSGQAPPSPSPSTCWCHHRSSTKTPRHGSQSDDYGNRCPPKTETSSAAWNHSSPPTPRAVAQQVEVVLDERPAAVVLTFDVPDWFVTACRERDIAVIALVGSAGRAQHAEIAGAEIIVAQGTEGGGHTGHVSTMVLLPSVVDTVSVPVLAAGGIVDGRGLAAARCLGAHGAWMGTRFIASDEGFGHRAYKDRLIAASSKHTTLSRAYTGKPLRTLQNDWTREWQGREDEIQPFPAQYAVAGTRVETGYQDGDLQQGMMPAGQAIELLHQIQPAGDIVRTIVADADRILRSAANSL